VVVFVCVDILCVCVDSLCVCVCVALLVKSFSAMILR